MQIYLIILLFFIVLIIFPLPFKFKISYSVFNNLGTFAYSVLGIKIKVFMYMFRRGDLIIRTKKKRKVVELTVSKEQIRFIEQLVIQIKNKVIIRKVVFHSNVGADDAMQAALMSCAINNGVKTFLAYLKSKKPYTKLVVDTNTTFNQKNLDVFLYAHISISIFDLLYCLIMSILITKRSDKYEGV